MNQNEGDPEEPARRPYRPYSIKSEHSTEKVYIRFLNKTGRHVDIYWLDFEGLPVKYYTLSPDRVCDIDTFSNHPWTFEDSHTRDALAVYGQQVFFPPKWSTVLRREFPNAPPNIPPHRIIVMITIPVYDLREKCLQVVRDNVKLKEGSELTKELEALQLPKSVLDDLILKLLQKDRIYL